MTLRELLRNINKGIEAERPNWNAQVSAADYGLFLDIVSKANREARFQMGVGHQAFRPPRDDEEQP